MKDPELLKEAVKALGGEFELIRKLGQGATSVVYLLRDHALDRDVAMKVIRATFAGDDEAMARLQREAHLVAQLTHPNIVKLYGTHRLTDGSFALFMEHVPGRNLKEILRAEGAFSVQRTMRVLTDVASALAYAHRRRIVHRDVKPENIYIDEEVGAARLADFGVARPWDQDARLTLPGASLGTPAYMSPEQIDGMEVDGRSDVYSLGLVGYELLLGSHPWEGENIFTIIYRQKNHHLSVETLGLGENSSLARTLKKALEKDPSKRLESATIFLEQLSEEDGPPPPDAPAMIQAPEEKESGEDLTPVDWGAVEATPEDAGPVPFSPSGDPDEDDAGNELAVLGVRPKKLRRPWYLALGGLAIIAFYALFSWEPWADSTMDPGVFIPISEPPAAVGEGTPSPNENGFNASTGLLPTQDSIYQGDVGSLLPLEVQAVGPGGTPMADTMVVFRVVEGNGILETETSVTDENGLAQATLRLPNRPGNMMVLAQVFDSDTLKTLLAVTAEIGPPQRVLSILGDGQAGSPGQTLAELVGVRVVDAFGNAVPDVDVRFQVLQGAGQVSPATSQTDDQGRAFARWTLGSTGGTHMVAAVVPGLENDLLTFQATAQVAATPDPEPPPTPTPAAEPANQGTPRTGPVTVISKTYAVGGSQVCHLVDGVAVCRGADDRGQAGDRTLTGLAGLSVGIAHACGLDAIGRAFCWGSNNSGQLGDGSTTDRRPAAAVASETYFSLLAGGLSHTCGLGSGGQASCWGRNVNGQLGTGTRQDGRRPVAVSGETSFQELIAGWNHTCGLSSGGRLSCWGANSKGQIGDGSQVDRLVPTGVTGSFQAVAAGAGHTCGITRSQVRCWGGNAFGQLGDGTTEDRSSPTVVSGLPGSAIAVTAGALHSCSLLSDRTVHCWGQNLHGQLGDGTTENRSAPVAVAGGLEFVAVHAGGGVTCGFTRGGAEYCWGLNQSGQLGDGSRTNRSTPTQVGGNRP
jgi:serine/threonine protein kinase/alpha-tubulin suppressor-like RCC1 family protein